MHQAGWEVGEIKEMEKETQDEDNSVQKWKTYIRLCLFYVNKGAKVLPDRNY